jgi:hypothetical protein
MPTYSYLNTQTNEEINVVMSISEVDEYEKNNPHLQRIYEKMTIVDPVTVGALKPPADFTKHVLGRVANMPGADKSKIYKRWHPPREV